MADLSGGGSWEVSGASFVVVNACVVVVEGLEGFIPSVSISEIYFALTVSVYPETDSGIFIEVGLPTILAALCTAISAN